MPIRTKLIQLITHHFNHPKSRTLVLNFNFSYHGDSDVVTTKNVMKIAKNHQVSLTTGAEDVYKFVY